MAKVEDYTDPFRRTYTPPAPAGDGVCDVCHSVPGPGFPRCWSCDQSTGSVSRPLTVVVPISLYLVGEQLHSVLRGYKDSPDPGARRRYRLRVAATLHRFMRDHSECIERAAGNSWDVLTIVPSKHGRGDKHPLERAIRLGRKLKDIYRPLLAPDQTQLIDRVYGNDRGFRATEDLAGQRVLLIDDTFTSGATFQSAASALALAGATVVAGVAIGRVIDTSDPRFAYKQEFWDRQRELGFSFDRCCLEP
ncbi:MAG: hypothetical protein H0W90_15960 [Actinobacteria bacterium]|nr:hypothetical protein [Actinomycetota bacterium]